MQLLSLSGRFWRIATSRVTPATERTMDPIADVANGSSLTRMCHWLRRSRAAGNVDIKQPRAEQSLS